MLCRVVLMAVLCSGFSTVGVAQNPDDDFGGSSEEDGSPRERGDRGDRGRGDRGERGDRGDRGRGRGPAPNLMFEAIDIDGDGTITARELKRAIVALKKLDTDNDGNLTLDEVTPQRGPGGDPNQFVDRMMENDLNGDGLLTPDEVPEQMARMLTGADLNADGAIDREELGQAMQAMRGRGGPGGPGGFGGRGMGGDPEQMTKQLMAGDRNGDNVLSPDEVPEQLHGMLADADTNGDGKINAKELRQAMETARQRMQRFQGGQGGNFNPRDRARQRPQQ